MEGVDVAEVGEEIGAVLLEVVILVQVAIFSTMA